MCCMSAVPVATHSSSSPPFSLSASSTLLPSSARFMPHKPNIVATKTPTAEVLLFDFNNKPAMPKDDKCKPKLRLAGHDDEGYGLAWSPLVKGLLLRYPPPRSRVGGRTSVIVCARVRFSLSCSGADDKKVCMWDVEKPPAGTRDAVPPLATFLAHTSVVEDVAWHAHHPDLFGTVGDDKQLMMCGAVPSLTARVAVSNVAHAVVVVDVQLGPP